MAIAFSSETYAESGSSVLRAPSTYPIDVMSNSLLGKRIDALQKKKTVDSRRNKASGINVKLAKSKKQKKKTIHLNIDENEEYVVNYKKSFSFEDATHRVVSPVEDISTKPDLNQINNLRYKYTNKK